MKSLRFRARLGLLGTLALLLAAWTELPGASAGAPTPGLSLTWAPATPTRIAPGETATARLGFVAGTVPPSGPIAVNLQLGNAVAAALPTGCTAGSVLSADGRRLTCNLGKVTAGQTVSADIEVTADAAPQIAVQAGDYDNGGTVLAHDVDLATASPFYRLISSPDFLNADIADLAQSPWDNWTPRKPNSWNTSYQAALEKVLADWKSFHPDAVSVIGDLVNGRWLKDGENLRTFGRVDTHAHRRATIRRAAATYFTAWAQRFRDAGLRVYPGVGDHDLGDNPWRGSPLMSEKREDAWLYRELFARYLTRNPGGTYKYPSRPVGTPWEGTAYAVRPNPNVQLVMLDVFRNTAGDTVAEVAGGQLAWLERVLAQAQADGVEWIVVEGHVPILGPVRRGPSSGLMYLHGSHSRLWSLFRTYGVDVYLDGEVHASTAIARDGIVQISHGGNVGYGSTATSRGGTSFVVADFGAGQLTMRLYSWNRTSVGGRSLWQMGQNRIPEFLTFHGAPVQIGAITLTSNGSSSINRDIVVDRSGLLTQFDPATEPGDYSPELP